MEAQRLSATRSNPAEGGWGDEAEPRPVSGGRDTKHSLSRNKWRFTQHTSWQGPLAPTPLPVRRSLKQVCVRATNENKDPNLVGECFEQSSFIIIIVGRFRLFFFSLLLARATLRSHAEARYARWVWGGMRQSRLPPTQGERRERSRPGIPAALGAACPPGRAFPPRAALH